jgi:serine/threonine-protein kinase
VPDPRTIDPAIPAHCTSVIQRAMAKEPRHRFQSAAELLAVLEALLAPPARVVPGSRLTWPPAHLKLPARQVQRLTHWPWVLAGVVLIGACVVGWLNFHGRLTARSAQAIDSSIPEHGTAPSSDRGITTKQ